MGLTSLLVVCILRVIGMAIIMEGTTLSTLCFTCSILFRKNKLIELLSMINLYSYQ